MRGTVLLASLLLSTFSAAQMSTLPGASAIADLPGPPKPPPIFSQMTVIMQGALEYQNLLDLKGPALQVERIEEQRPGRNPHPFQRKTTFKFDEHRHLAKAIYEDPLGLSTTTNTWDGNLLERQDVVHHGNNGTRADSDEWQQWSYDKSGHLSEFRAGKDKEAEPLHEFQIRRGRSASRL